MRNSLNNRYGIALGSAFLSTLMLVGCGGGASSSGSSVSETPVSSSVKIADTQASNRYDVSPNVSSCSIGKLKDTEKMSALAQVNYIRSLHSLPAVSYNAAWDDEVAQASLIMVANNTLDHYPKSSFACYSASGASAASSSNLYYVNNPSGTLAEDSAEAINYYLTDYYSESSNEPSLGHRLWVLDPFVTQVAFGRVDGSPANSTRPVMASALKVIGGPRSAHESFTSEYVAYPVGNYPKSLFAKSFYLSFSVVADHVNSWNNSNKHVDYSTATVSVVNAQNSAMGVNEQAYSYAGYGLGNVLKWKVAGLQDNQAYTVTIGNVKVNGVYQSYTYSFTLS